MPPQSLVPSIPHRLALSLWPNFTLTQFLTNHGKFRFYLHKMKKTASPTCSCPDRAVQTARHLMTECSQYSRNRPAILQKLPPHMILKHHIHTASVSSLLNHILHSLQEEPEGKQAPQLPRHNDMSTDRNTQVDETCL
jgi:hypothetical protein